jgi:hypothetical protein
MKSLRNAVNEFLTEEGETELIFWKHGISWLIATAIAGFSIGAVSALCP